MRSNIFSQAKPPQNTRELNKINIILGLEVVMFIHATEMFCQQLNWLNLVSLLPRSSTLLEHQGFMQRAVFPSSGRVFAFQDGGFYRYPSTGRRRQTGRPNARLRTGCIARRTSFLRIVLKVLRLVYYCASVGADFYSFSYRTSCDLVARDQNLSPLAQPGFWR